MVGLIQATCASRRVYSLLHDADETSASPSPGPSVLAQVGTSRHILLTFLTRIAFFRLLSASEVATFELPCAFCPRSSSAFRASVQDGESLKALGNYGVYRQV